jgi:hypothetical protein
MFDVDHMLLANNAPDRAEKNPRNSRRERGLQKAEGKGFEPSTGFPAPDFESGRSPFAYPPEVA